MKTAFPRQREQHLYKKRLVCPSDHNLNFSLIDLKREEQRINRGEIMQT